MTYQDLRHLLRGFLKNGIVVCLNPQCQTGRFYVLASEKDKFQVSNNELDICA